MSLYISIMDARVKQLTPLGALKIPRCRRSLGAKDGRRDQCDCLHSLCVLTCRVCSNRHLPPNMTLQLSADDFLCVCCHIKNPVDLLSLSSISGRAAELIRTPAMWKQRLTRDGWDVDAIYWQESNKIVYVDQGSSWLFLARAACDRYAVFNQDLHRGTGSLLRRLHSVVSQIGG